MEVGGGRGYAGGSKELGGGKDFNFAKFQKKSTATGHTPPARKKNRKSGRFAEVVRGGRSDTRKFEF